MFALDNNVVSELRKAKSGEADRYVAAGCLARTGREHVPVGHHDPELEMVCRRSSGAIGCKQPSCGLGWTTM